ncbi:MAG TPA: hypothetical protein VL221_13070 [Bacteroidota bacterium]|nr:hypothetical protein [Bacteroidota bacterium]
MAVRAGLDSLSRGTGVNLVLYDRRSFRGDFVQLAPIPNRIYQKTYDTVIAKARYSRLIPRLGQHVVIFSQTGADSGEFAGISLSEALVQPANRPDTVGVPLDEIRWIQSADSNRLDGNVLLKLVHAGSIPGRYDVQLEVDHGIVDVEYERVDLVEVMPTSSGALAGFLVGAAVDLTAAILIMSAERDAESDCGSSARTSSVDCSGRAH